MDFNSTRPIYLQICDDISEQILSGSLTPDARIPSVREYGATIGVNPNTVMRNYEKLTADGVIYNTRGIGYFVSADARDRIMQSVIQNARKSAYAAAQQASTTAIMIGSKP